MNSHDQVWQSLNHREPEHVPFDLGGQRGFVFHFLFQRVVEEVVHSPNYTLDIPKPGLYYGSDNRKPANRSRLC